MAEPDTLESLAADLEQLSAANRQQILATLSSVERHELERLLNPQAEMEAPAPTPDLETFFSPWLGARLKEAAAGQGAMTVTARQQLLKVASETVEAPIVTTVTSTERQSLLQFLVRKLDLRKAPA